MHSGGVGSESQFSMTVICLYITFYCCEIPKKKKKKAIASAIV